jgi:DNA-binding beta-propeller fold protein YncE
LRELRVYELSPDWRTRSALSLLDTRSGILAQQIDLPADSSNIALSPDGRYLFIAGRLGFRVLDTSTGAIVTTTPLPPGPASGLGVTPDCTRAYVALPQRNSVVVLDTSAYR